MYKFDVALDAKASIKERFVWMLYLGILFFLLYGAANQWASLHAPHHVIQFGWEENIPFIEAFIIPYMATDLMFVVAFFLPYTRLELRVLSLRVFAIVVFSVVMFVLFPLQFSLEKPEIVEFRWLFGLLEADLPYNQAPSLHVSFAIVLWYAMQTQIKSLFLRILLALWFGLIVLSTLFVYQHHFIDLPTGALVGFLVVYFISPKREKRILYAFTTPRSLKMALYYLVASVFFMILAFTLSFWFLYPFLSLFLVSVIYAFGLNSWLMSDHRIAYLFKYILFAPYILGNTLSWWYYKRRLPLMTEVEASLYFGRLYDKKEVRYLEERGIKHVINLAMEHFVVGSPKGFTYHHLPFLDQTIPSPQELHKAVLLIEKYKDQGLYLHCALGLSRSVLVISAWLLYRGEKRIEIEKRMKQIRPNYVKSAYMGIALDIYEAWYKKRDEVDFDRVKA